MRCGERLGEACLDALTVAHNLDHCQTITNSSFGGIDPSVFRLGNLPYVIRLISIQTDDNAFSSMTYNDMCLFRSTPEKRRNAIGINDSADEQMARDYGPLKNACGNPSHKSSQNKENRGSSSRPSLTLRDYNRHPKRRKINHIWKKCEDGYLEKLVDEYFLNFPDKIIDWGAIHDQFCGIYKWATEMTTNAFKCR
jgi:hypothetical protein